MIGDNKVPFIFVVGANEMKDNTVAIRRLGSNGQEIIDLDDGISLILKESSSPDKKN